MQCIAQQLQLGSSQNDARLDVHFAVQPKLKSRTWREALYISNYVRHLPVAEQENFVNRLLLKAESERSAEATSQRTYCAFLKEGLCSIYTVGPAVCRKTHSLSAKAFESFISTLPQDLAFELQGEVILKGTNDGFLQNALPAWCHELSAAILAVLGNPHAAEDWFCGKTVLPSLERRGRGKQ